jgi:hypothetical protein
MGRYTRTNGWGLIRLPHARRLDAEIEKALRVISESPDKTFEQARTDVTSHSHQQAPKERDVVEADLLRLLSESLKLFKATHEANSGANAASGAPSDHQNEITSSTLTDEDHERMEDRSRGPHEYQAAGQEALREPSGEPLGPARGEGPTTGIPADVKPQPDQSTDRPTARRRSRRAKADDLSPRGERGDRTRKGDRTREDGPAR